MNSKQQTKNPKIGLGTVLKLQDIAIMPNLSDPRVNTALCVVTGHDGDPEQDIDSPYVWYKGIGIWIFQTTVTTSFFITEVMNTLIQSEWTDNFCHEQNKWRLRTILLTELLYSVVLIGITLSALILASNKSQMVYHMLWVLCGGISADPLHAIPLFLCECLAMFAPVYAICLYQKDQQSYVRRQPLMLGVLSFLMIIGNMVISFYGHTVIVPTASIIEITAVAMLCWLVKSSGLNFLSLGTAGSNNGSSNSSIDITGTDINDH